MHCVGVQYWNWTYCMMKIDMIIKMCLCTCLWQLICLFLEVTYITAPILKAKFPPFQVKCIVGVAPLHRDMWWLATHSSQSTQNIIICWGIWMCTYLMYLASNTNSCFSETIVMVLCCVWSVVPHYMCVTTDYSSFSQIKSCFNLR